MNTLQTVIALIFLPTSIVGGIVFVLRKFFEQGLARDIEKYRAALQAELERSKLQMQNDLQIKLFEYQTKFSSLHQKQAEVIGELYGLLGDAKEYIVRLVDPTFNPADTAHIEATTAKYRALAECFVKNRIYLEENTCDRIDELLRKWRVAMMKASIGQRPEPGGHGVEWWAEAHESVKSDVPPILKELETQFRAFLSPTFKTDA
ncbi:MAG: hypothetical protein AABM67_17320 [Acidobacteriota bacterium]